MKIYERLRKLKRLHHYIIKKDLIPPKDQDVFPE